MIVCTGKHTLRFKQPVEQATPFRLAENQHVLLMPIGDVHYGAPGFPTARLRAHLEWGMERGAYFLGMGDFVDFTSESQRKLLGLLRNSARASLDDLGQLQVNELFKILHPTRGRWLGLLGGNHGHVFQDGTCSEQRLADMLGTAYLGDLGVVPLVLGRPEKKTIWVFAHHGLSGGRTMGAGLLRVEDMPKAFPQGHIYLMGHIHSKVNAPLTCCYVAPNGAVYHETKWLARTGSWQRGYLATAPLPNHRPAIESEGSYIEKAMRQPAALGGLVFGLGCKYNEEAKLWVPDIHCSA